MSGKKYFSIKKRLNWGENAVFASLLEGKFPSTRGEFVKFNKSVDECESFQDKLLFTLCNAHKLEEKPKQLEGELFDRLFEIARISNFNAEELSQYEANRMNMLDYNASMIFARKEGVAVGTALGRDEGIALGRDEGVAIGVEKGIALGRNEGLLQTARKMKAKGFNTAVIAEITGLSEAEIEGLL